MRTCFMKAARRGVAPGCFSVGVVWIIGMLIATRSASAFSVSYDQKTISSGQAITSKVTVKDKQFRVESTIDGMSSIILHNSSGTYHYLPDQHMAIKLASMDVAGSPVSDLDHYHGYLNERNAKLIGTDTVNGYSCDVYRYIDPASGGSTTAWVWKSKQFPVKLEQQGKQGFTTAEMSHIQFDSLVPDSAFQLPSGVKVMEMGDMMNPDALTNLMKGPSGR